MVEQLISNRMFYYFLELCKIPHGSGNTDAVSEYCVDFAKAHGLEYIKDTHNNVIIKKQASSGFEDKAPVILQGHLDMVCEKVSGKEIDFEKEGITPLFDGEFIRADGTTLGADNGIAVAMVLSILEDDSLAHPPIEALFTTDEETGMFGAIGLDASALTAERLINIDSENEGVLTVSCAGGARADICLPLESENTKMPCVKISLSGLSGGHSGVEIDKGRLNADIALAHLLSELKGEYYIASLSGGLKDNAIPRAAECVISLSEDIYALAKDFCRRYASGENSGLKIDITDAGLCDVYTAADSKKAVALLSGLKNGVQKMSEDIIGLVQTSLNLGVMKTEDNALKLTVSFRSSVGSEKQSLIEEIKAYAESFGATFADKSHYPAWEFKKDSPLQRVMCRVYKEMTDKDMRIEAIHAGLECGLFCEKITGLDAVSIGPDMYDIHTPAERLSAASAKSTYAYLCKVLGQLE